MSNRLPWLDKYLEGLNKDSLQHAFIIGGKEGVGKNNFSRTLSNFILCEQTLNKKACEKCQSCKLFLSLNHPDFHLVSLEDGKKKISINQIKELQSKFYESAFLGGNKVFLIESAEHMSNDAIDSVLKILEEPPNNTFFLITSHRLKQLPLTLQSRCSEIYIKSPTKKIIQEWLIDEGLNIDNVALALDLALGQPLKVKELLEANLEASRNQFIKDISILIKEGKNIISLSEEWSKDSLSFTLKLEWMSNLMMDAIRFQNTKEQKNLMKDTSNISMYLGERTNFNILYDLLISTNSLWSVFTDGTNLKSEYQLQKLFIDWESKLGLSVR